MINAETRDQKTMTLRIARPDDAGAIADLGRRAFVARFGHLYSAANLDRFLTDFHTPAKVAGEIADPGMRIAVIEDRGTLLSYCKITLASTLPRHSDARRPIELKQLYTDPDRIGRGHGARLMAWALDEARAHGADEMQLSVYADNPEAQRFYVRHGFAWIADITFWVGDHCDPEFLFARPIEPSA